jgi:predicted  nucleic acid-binding Zn-ribbon protein
MARQTIAGLQRELEDAQHRIKQLRDDIDDRNGKVISLTNDLHEKRTALAACADRETAASEELERVHTLSLAAITALGAAVKAGAEDD